MVAKPLCPLYKNIIKPLDKAHYPELRYGFALNYLIMLGGAIGLNICVKVFCPAKVYKILFGNRC